MSFSFINIVGYGYVGSSLGYLCKQNKIPFTITDTTDKTEKQAAAVFKNIDAAITWSEIFNDTNVYIICVPTPSKESGECDTSIIHNVIDDISKNATKKSLVCIKSTVQPRTSRILHEKYSTDLLTIVFVPEFLTERRAHLDMYEANFALVGTHSGEDNKDVSNLFKQLYSHAPDIEIITKKYEICEMFKYTVNIFLAVKVWYFNEIHELSEKLDFDYNDLRDLFKLDSRIGSSHTAVPGHDGRFGYGLGCLPKEIKAGSNLQEQLGIPNKIWQEIIERNTVFREKIQF